MLLIFIFFLNLKSAACTTASETSSTEATSSESSSATASESSATHEDGRSSASRPPEVGVGRLAFPGEGMSAMLANISRLFGDESVGT